MIGWLWLGLVLVALAVGAVWLPGRFVGARNDQSKVTAQPASSMSSLSDLLTLPVGALEQVDVARMNLLCAQGLPGAEDLDVNGCLATLQEMVVRVRSETERYHYRFDRNPAEFENSEGFFKMVIMAVVLAEDFNVKYAPNKMVTAAEAQADDGFFADAHDVFLHGLLGEYRAGTCSSLPVLQVAVGRRLGYVYIGNVPGLEGAETTWCPNCKKAIVERDIFAVTRMDIADGKCRFCSAKIAGVWG